MNYKFIVLSDETITRTGENVPRTVIGGVWRTFFAIVNLSGLLPVTGEYCAAQASVGRRTVVLDDHGTIIPCAPDKSGCSWS